MNPWYVNTQNGRWKKLKENNEKTSHRHKQQRQIERISGLAKDIGIELITPADINLDLEIEEDGATYVENAVKKASAFAKASRLISLADDSGLEVDALDGAPGLYSKRYSPKPNASDADRRIYMIGKSQGKASSLEGALPCHNCHCNLRKGCPVVEGNCFGEIIPRNAAQAALGMIPFFYSRIKQNYG